MSERSTNSFIDERVAMMNDERRHLEHYYWNNFSREFFVTVEAKLTKINAWVVKNVVYFFCFLCRASEERASLINSRVIENKSYLYLFIIHDADVDKDICVYLSRGFTLVSQRCLLFIKPREWSEILYRFDCMTRTLLRLCDKSRAQRMQNGWEKRRNESSRNPFIFSSTRRR